MGEKQNTITAKGKKKSKEENREKNKSHGWTAEAEGVGEANQAVVPFLLRCHVGNECLLV